MANAYYDDVLFDEYVAKKPSYDFVVRKSVVTAGHVDNRFLGILGCTLDNTPGTFEPEAYLLTNEGALPASSPAIYDGYFAYNRPVYLPKFHKGFLPDGTPVLAVERHDPYQWSAHRLPNKFRSMLNSVLSVEDDDVFPLVALEKGGDAGEPSYTKAVFISGANSRIVTGNYRFDPSNYVKSSSSLTRLVGLATGVRSWDVVTFGRLLNDLEYENVPNVRPFTTQLHTYGYAVRGSLVSDSAAGVYKLAASNGRLGVSVSLQPGTTSLEINGGGYKPFTLPPIDCPLVRFLRVRPLLNPATLDGISGYKLQIGLLDKIAGSTEAVGTLPDSEYSDGRHNIRFQYVEYSDAWCTSQVSTHAAEFELDPVQYGDYSGFYKTDVLPTAVIRNVSNYHAVMVDIDANVSDLSAIKAVYVSVKLDKAFIPTVFVVEASVDGKHWESVAELDVFGFIQDVRSELDNARSSRRTDDTPSDGYSKNTRKHLVDVTVSRVATPAVLILRKGWNL